MNKIIVKQYEIVLQCIIDKALNKLSCELTFDSDRFFVLWPERRLEILKNYMSPFEVKFITSSYQKHPELRRHIDWLSS